jgi:hypothetical protein
MTIQATSAIAYRTDSITHTPTQPARATAPDAPGPATLQQLATAAVRAIQQRLAVDLVWIGEVAPERRHDPALEDDDEGCGPPDVTVLATTAVEPADRSRCTDPVLPTCLTQIAWEVAGVGHTEKISLRNPSREITACPVALQSGTRLVLIAVARPNTLTPRDVRTLERLITAIGIAIDSPEAVALAQQGDRRELKPVPYT